MEADGQQTAPEATAPDQTSPEPQVNDALMSRLDEMSKQIGSLTQPQDAPAWEGGISDLPYAEGDPSQGFQPDQGFDPYQQQDPNGQGFDQYQPGQYAPDQYQDPQQGQ